MEFVRHRHHPIRKCAWALRGSFARCRSSLLGWPTAVEAVDASFYWRRLRRTACLAGLLGVINAVSGMSGSVPATPPPANPQTTSVSSTTLMASTPSVDAADREAASRERTAATSEERISIGPRSVPPVGWRRTANGWEHVSEWPSAHTPLKGISAQVSISDRIVSLEKSEPAHLRHWMDRLRATHPVIIALGQIACVGLLLGGGWVFRTKVSPDRTTSAPNQLAS